MQRGRETYPGTQRMAAGFHDLVGGAEELLKASSDRSAGTFAAAKSRFHDTVVKARARLTHAQSRAVERARAASNLAERHVADHPWRTLAVVGAAGLVIGWLMDRGGTPR
jgi:ElaB/YqjD/DUF883 family membrane-anchored ribosome-binding protein